MSEQMRRLGAVLALVFVGCGVGSRLIGRVEVSSNSSQSGGTSESTVGDSTAAASTPSAPKAQPAIGGKFDTEHGKAVITTNGDQATMTVGPLVFECKYTGNGESYSHNWDCTWKKGSDSGVAKMHIGTGQDDKDHVFGKWTKKGDTTETGISFMDPGYDFKAVIKAPSSSGSSSSGGTSGSVGKSVGESCSWNTDCAKELRCLEERVGSASHGKKCTAASGTKCGANSDCNSDKLSCSSYVCK